MRQKRVSIKNERVATKSNSGFNECLLLFLRTNVPSNCEIDHVFMEPWKPSAIIAWMFSSTTTSAI